FANTKSDSLRGAIMQDSSGKEQLIEVETKLLKITFSNKGGQPQKIEIKKYKTFDGKPLILQDGQLNNISYPINTGINQTAQTSDLLFTPSSIQINADSTQIISFRLQTRNGESIEHQYILRPDNYMIGFNIKLSGANNLVTKNTLNLLWEVKAGR